MAKRMGKNRVVLIEDTDSDESQSEERDSDKIEFNLANELLAVLHRHRRETTAARGYQFTHRELKAMSALRESILEAVAVYESVQLNAPSGAKSTTSTSTTTIAAVVPPVCSLVRTKAVRDPQHAKDEERMRRAGACMCLQAGENQTARGMPRGCLIISMSVLCALLTYHKQNPALTFDEFAERTLKDASYWERAITIGAVIYREWTTVSAEHANPLELPHTRNVLQLRAWKSLCGQGIKQVHEVTNPNCTEQIEALLLCVRQWCKEKQQSLGVSFTQNSYSSCIIGYWDRSTAEVYWIVFDSHGKVLARQCAAAVFQDTSRTLTPLAQYILETLTLGVEYESESQIRAQFTQQADLEMVSNTTFFDATVFSAV